MQQINTRGGGGFDQMTKAKIRRICAKVKEMKVETTVITTIKDIMFEMGITTATTTSTMLTIVIEMIEVGPMFHLKIVKFLLDMVEVVWRELRICC